MRKQPAPGSAQHLVRLGEEIIGSPAGRRRLLLLLAAAGAAGLTFGCRRRESAARSAGIRFDGWGGSVQEALHNSALLPFSRKSGIPIIEGTFDDELTILNAVRTSQPGDYNVIQSSGVVSYKRYVDLGFNSIIDESNVPNLRLLMKPMIAALRQVTPTALSGVPYSYGTSGIAYNTRHFSDADIRGAGAAILLDSQLRGKIGALNDMQTRVWYAALQSGQNPNAIADMDAIWQKTRESRAVILKYWDSGAELMNLLGKEEILITDAYSGRVAAMQKEGFPIGYYNPPGTLAWIDDIFVLKGSPMPECEALLNFMLEPEVAIAVAEGEMYAPSLDPLRIPMPKSIRELPTFDATGRLDGLVLADPFYWSNNYERWERRWHHIMKGA
jgi:spermidine/putrescine transport system substrate-binding protein